MFSFFKGKTSVAASAPPPGGNGPRPAGMALLPAPRSEADQIRDFQEGLVKLQAAIQRNKGLRAKLDAIQNMGAWSAVWGALSGGNDRDLAEMLSEYGASLETTQSVVQLLAQVHTVKTNVLRSFHGALVEQIESIVANVGALDADGNAAYMVMQDFKEQIEDLIEAADSYERCWQEVRSLRDALDAQDVQLGRQDGALDGLQEQVRQIERGMQAAEQGREAAEIRTGETLRGLNEALAGLSARVERDSGAAVARHALLQSGLEQRLDAVEQRLHARGGWLAALRGQAIALAAVGLGCAALFLNR